MGAWGTAISSNDTFADIYADFFDLYNEGLTVEEITEKLLNKNQDMIESHEDNHDFWFAIAQAQWECKSLDPVVLNRVKHIIDSGSNFELWKELEASDSDIKKRKKVLEKFLLDLQSERAKPRIRKKKIKLSHVFEKGDCITFKFSTGNFGGAVILEAVDGLGYNLIASTRINKQTKPTIEDFINSEVLILNYENWDNKLCVNWYFPKWHKKVANLIEKIGRIDIGFVYDVSNTDYGLMGDFNIWIIETAESQFIWEKTFPKPPKIKTIKGLTKKQMVEVLEVKVSGP